MRTPHAPRGLTLVELLVAIALGMLLMVAVSGMLVRQEGARRTLTATNDVVLNGAHVSHLVDRTLRSAGSGFSQSWRAAYGCRLTVARQVGGASTQLLPRGTDWTAPFNNFTRSPRLVPVVAHAGAGTGGSDVLAVFSGNSSLGELPLRMTGGSATVNSVGVPATVGLAANDLLLLAEPGRADCMMQQVVGSFAGFGGGATQQIDLGGDYSAATIGTLNLVDFNTGTVNVVPLGNSAGRAPSFQLLGIGANRTLVALDMLRIAGGATDPVTPLADGVVELRVRYGITSNPASRLVDTWVSPADTGWTAADLMDGSAAAQDKLYRILAVRVGMVLRDATADNKEVTAADPVLFPDLAAALRHTFTLTPDLRRHRYRAIEFTVPLRNVMLI